MKKPDREDEIEAAAREIDPEAFAKWDATRASLPNDFVFAGILPEEAATHPALDKARRALEAVDKVREKAAKIQSIRDRHRTG
jgi:uncharacterized Zn finger protein (UPF0148 family)